MKGSEELYEVEKVIIYLVLFFKYFQSNLFPVLPVHVSAALHESLYRSLKSRERRLDFRIKIYNQT